MTKSPSGFFQSEAIFARNLFGATPADAVKLRGRQASLVLRNVEIGFVEGQRLNQVGVAFEDFAHLTGDGPIAGEVRGQEDCVWAETFGPNSGHGGTHAELSSFIRSGAHYGAIPAPRDDNGFATQLRIVSLLYGRIKRIHIDVNDLASGHLVTILFRGRGKCERCLFGRRLFS